MVPVDNTRLIIAKGLEAMDVKARDLENHLTLINQQSQRANVPHLLQQRIQKIALDSVRLTEEMKSIAKWLRSGNHSVA